MTDDPAFDFGPNAEYRGWHGWTLRDQTRYNGFLGKVIVRREGDQARVRMFPVRRHSNLADNLHGAATLGFIDVALFAASRMLGLIGAGRAVTLDLSTQFIGAGRVDAPLDAKVELLRETRQLLFLRGLVVQDHHKVAAFAGTIRRSSGPRPAE